jgi:ABC-type glycerol-3-phosphate transport system substrate-binding protein
MKKTLALILSMLLVLALVPASLAESTVELDFWTVFTGEDGVNMDQLVANFNEANPGIKVNHMKMDAADLYTKAPLAVTAGEGVPDVCIVHAERIAQFVKDGIFNAFDRRTGKWRLRSRTVPVSRLGHGRCRRHPLFPAPGRALLGLLREPGPAGQV